MESGLRGLRSDFLRVFSLLEQTKELLALLFVFRVDMDRFGLGCMSVHRIASANDVNLSKGDQGEDAVNQGGDGREGKGGNG